ncbi:MAG TPA: hypothetical protein VMV94_08500 [Phycisphaerae bacterium]|nr:hypothetical protein [Phycisphaerae bacterium]
MPTNTCRFLAFCFLCAIVVLSPTASVWSDDGGGGGDVFLMMPGQWTPIPEWSSPSVLPALFGEEIHRPAVRIQPGPGARPAIVASVYAKPALYGLTSSLDGNQLISLTYGGTVETGVVMPLPGSPGLPGEIRGLAFDPLSGTVYALFGYPEDPEWTPPSSVCAIDAGTGTYTCNQIPSQYPHMVGLALDSARDVFYTIMFAPEGPWLLALRPFPFVDMLWMIGLPTPGSNYTVTDLAFDPEGDVLYALYSSDINTCRLVAYHVDSGVMRTIDLTGPYAAEPYKAAWDPCSRRLLFLGRLSSALFSLDPVMDSAPQLVGLIASNEPSVIAFCRPESWGLDYATYDGGTLWNREPIDNRQGSEWDPLWYWGDQRFHTCGAASDPELGRIDGMSFLYRDGLLPVVAWTQRVDGQFSEILVAAKDPGTGEWGAVGWNAYGIPSNKLPGISSTFAFATDPKIMSGLVGGQERLIVAWLERFDSPASSGEVYARYYDEGACQWLELGLGCASDYGLTQTGGTVDSFDAAVLSAADPSDRRIVVAYSCAAEDRQSICVKTWKDAFQYWDEFSSGSASPGYGISQPPEAGMLDSHPAIAAGPDSGTLFIAWRRQTPGQPWQVMGRQYFGAWPAGWHGIGGGDIIHRPALTSATISHPTATFDKQYVVAWEQDLPTEAGKREVLVKVWKDYSWQEIGAGSSSAGGISGSYAIESVYPQLLTDPNLQPVVAWDEGGLAFVRRFDQPLTQSADCDNDWYPDDAEIANCSPGDKSCADCNKNGVPDGCDIATGYSLDIDPPNGVPDECEAPPIGDLNCDRAVDIRDIPHFVQALVDPVGYQQAHSGPPFGPCDWLLADVNGDSSIDGRDVTAFVEVLLAQ